MIIGSHYYEKMMFITDKKGKIKGCYVLIATFFNEENSCYFFTITLNTAEPLSLLTLIKYMPGV